MAGLPYIFVPDTIADANQVNANFQYLASLNQYFVPAAPTDGTTDAFPAISASIAAAAANGGGTVLLGPYTYQLSAMLQVNAPQVNIMGMGGGTTVLAQNFTPSSTNPAILFSGPNSKSCIFQAFSLQGPGVSATGSVPGPTTPSAPQLGSGWAFLNFGGSQNIVDSVNADGTYHGFGTIVFSEQHFRNCQAGMGGAQVQQQFGFFAMGPEGSAATGSFTIGGTVTAGDTLSIVLDDGQGNVLTTGPYTVTTQDANASNPAFHAAISFTTFINNGNSVVGPLANWNPAQSGGAVITLSIDIPPTASQPTYTPSATGGHTTVTPDVLTQVTGGTRQKNPVSQVVSFVDCSMPHASLKVHNVGNFASSEGIHIDGAVTSVGVQNFGTTAALYTIRVVNQLSGSNKPAKFLQLANISSDHTHFSGISLEDATEVRLDGVHNIANFGGGSPAEAWAINIGNNCGSVEIYSPSITSCQSGGIGIGSSGPVLIDAPKIFQVGNHYLSGIGFYGSNSVVGVTIKGGKIGANDLSSGGGGNNSYAIDLVGPGSPNSFTGTMRSLTIQNVDVTGLAGAINVGTVISAALTANGAGAYNTIQHNPGYDPTLTVTQPTPPSAGSPGATTYNPFAADCLVWVVPAGGASITAINIVTNDGTITQTVSYSTPFAVMVPANTGIELSFPSGTITWNWWPI